MQNSISIMTGLPLLKINRESRELGTELTIVIGNLFNKFLLKGRNINKKNLKQRSEILLYLTNQKELHSNVLHCYGSDDKIYLKKTSNSMKYLSLFDRMFYTTFVGKSLKKIIGISGFYGEVSDIYNFNDDYLKKMTEKETWCDILCVNSLNKDNITTFSPSFYELIFKIKPKLIVIGGNKKLEIVKFPLTDIQTVLIGKNDHIIWDYSTNSVYRKL